MSAFEKKHSDKADRAGQSATWEMVLKLEDMGFPNDRAVAALRAANDNFSTALELLVSGITFDDTEAAPNHHPTVQRKLSSPAPRSASPRPESPGSSPSFGSWGLPHAASGIVTGATKPSTESPYASPSFGSGSLPHVASKKLTGATKPFNDSDVSLLSGSWGLPLATSENLTGAQKRAYEARDSSPSFRPYLPDAVREGPHNLNGVRNDALRQSYGSIGAATSESFSEPFETVTRLEAMGFPRDAVVDALHTCNGDFDQTLDSLLTPPALRRSASLPLRRDEEWAHRMPPQVPSPIKPPQDVYANGSNFAPDMRRTQFGGSAMPEYPFNGNNRNVDSFALPRMRTTPALFSQRAGSTVNDSMFDNDRDSDLKFPPYMHTTAAADLFKLPTYSMRGSNGAMVTALVIGETGSGKSTFMNTLINHFRGGSIKNLKVAIPTRHLRATENFASHESDVNNVSASQTTKCTVYDLAHFRFIDTPGLSDTRGTQQDDANIDGIIEAAKKEKTLSAIILVINGSVPRQTVNMRNALTRLRGVLPNSIMNNLIVVFTMCRQATRNFDLAALKGLKLSKTLHMNNSAFSTDPKDWDEGERKHLALEWESSMKTIRDLLPFLESMTAQGTKDFEAMQNARDKIRQTLHDAKLKMAELQKLQDDIAAAEMALGRFANDEQQFANYTQQKVVKKKELVDASYHSTLCSRCNSVCHDHCGLEFLSQTGAEGFRGCACMNGGSQCEVCEGHCDHTTHYHAQKTMQETEQTLEEVLHDIKAKYDQAVQGKSSQQLQLTTVSQAKSAVQGAINACTQDVKAECRKLKQICSGFNLVDELSETLKQVEMEARSLQSTEARDTADKFVAVLKGIINSLMSGPL